MLAVWVRAGLCAISVLGVEICIAAEKPVLPDSPQVELLWNDGEFTEGVATAADGTVYFSDIAIGGKRPGRVMKFDPRTRQTTVFVADSGQSNGLFFTPSGELLAACGAINGHRALCEILPDGSMKPLASKFDGQLLNSPNDLAVHPKGWVYFSDPRYVGPEPLELDHQSVYRLDPDGKLHRATTDISKPNGVIIAPNGQMLYVAETDNGATGQEPPGTPPKPARYTLNAFPIRDDGSLGAKKVLVDLGTVMGIDGMTMDTAGRIYAAVRIPERHGIAIYSPAGKELEFLKLEPNPTNCTFGRGDGTHDLYITADTGLYRLRINATGHHP